MKNNYKVVEEYKQLMLRMLPFNIPEPRKYELELAIQYSIDKRFKDHDIGLHNNYKNLRVNTTLAKLMDYIIDRKPIMTPYGTLFSRHANVPNPLTEMMAAFLAIRKKYKKEMFKYPKGTEEFDKYNLLQLVAKVDTNAIYGSLGQPNSIFYNIYCAASITAAGKGCISASIMFFEAFLSNNVKFGSLNEVVLYIDNIRREAPLRTDTDHLFRQVQREEVYLQILSTCGYYWLPDEEEQKIIWGIIDKLPQQDLNRVYYKNNLYEFCDNKVIQDIIIRMLVKLRHPFLDPNSPPEEIQDDMTELLAYMKEYVYYGYMTIDKIMRVEQMIRNIVLVTDTDSCIICLDTWYHYILELTKGVDMKIKYTEIDICKRLKQDEFGDIDFISIANRVEPMKEYDFYNQEIVEQLRSVNPAKIIPQDGLRHSIINIMSHICSKLILDFMIVYSKHYNSFDPSRDCLLIMKNEFLFKSVLLTNGKKNYASIQEVQEGNIVPSEAGLAITGLPLDKIGVPESTSKELKRILHDYILDPQDVEQMKVLNELAVLEKTIFLSLQAGETKYYKPARIKSYDSYETPMRIQGIKGSIAYNRLKNNNDEEINLNSTNTVLIIKTEVNKKTIDSIKDSYPDTYNKMVELINTKEYAGKLDSIAIPANLPVPEWIVPFIDYKTIIHDNLNSFPLESIGIHRFDNKHVTYSNILNL